jgi:hypothetical protein
LVLEAPAHIRAPQFVCLSCEHVFVSRKGPRYSRDEAVTAVASSRSFSEALRKLGMRPAGGNHATLKKYVEEWGLSTTHFDPAALRVEHLRRLGASTRRPLHEILVEKSTYNRGCLKRRLYEERLKERLCELCGQDEVWRGRRMTLILDHINGVANDNRLENLRIVCPNCAATLDTHCGRNQDRTCPVCRQTYRPKRYEQRYCSHACFAQSNAGTPRPGQRKIVTHNGHTRRVVRPPYRRLLQEIDETSYCAVGRKYRVSDNAIRKWVRQYERERGLAVLVRARHAAGFRARLGRRAVWGHYAQHAHRLQPEA